MLSGAHLNSPGVLLTPPERAAMWLKVAQAYLKAENAASVESSLKAAAEHLRALAPEARLACAGGCDFLLLGIGKRHGEIRLF